MNTANQNQQKHRLLRALHAVEDGFLVLILSTMIGFAVTQIIMRNIFDSGISWADPLLRLLVLWVGLAGAMVATREDHHISINVVTRTLPPRLQLAARIFVDLFTCMVSAIIAYHSVRFVQMDREAEIIAFAHIPAWWCELIIPLAFSVIALRYMIYTVLHAQQLVTGKQEN